MKDRIAYLDGVRGVAIAAVLVTHLFASLGLFGEIGVTIFFTLSGYLVGGILIRGAEKGSLTPTHFYARRTRRILPMSIVICAAVLVAGYFLLSSGLYYDTAEIIKAHTYMFSPYVFMNTGVEYGEIDSKINPLVILWSLAIEELFYVSFFWVIYLGWKRSRTTVICITVVLFVLSAGYSTWATLIRADSAYFNPLARFPEILMGVLARFVVIQNKRRFEVEVASVVGVIFAIGPMFYLAGRTNSDALFPGPTALISACGTAVILIANGSGCDTSERSFVSKVLSWKPLVWIGLISYSLYLVHYPLYIFWRGFVQEFGVAHRVTLIVVSIIVSTFTYFSIEQTFQKKFSNVSNRLVISIGCFALGVLFACSSIVVFQKGLPGRYPEWENSSDLDPVIVIKDIQGEKLRYEKFGTAEDKPIVMITGDSHCSPHSEEVRKAMREVGIAGEMISRSATCPIPGTLVTNNACYDNYEWKERLEEYVVASGVKHVVIISRWHRFIPGAYDYTTVVDRGDPAPSDEVVKRQLTDFVRRMTEKGVTVWVLLQPPEYEMIPATKLVSSRGTAKGMSLQKFEEQTARYLSMIEGTGVKIIDITPYIVDEDGYTRLMYEGRPVYQTDDNDHYNVKGAKQLRGMWKEVFSEMKQLSMYPEAYSLAE